MDDPSSHLRAIHQYVFGWVVQCPICGKRTKRSFLRRHPDSLMNAERYWAEHLASEVHRAATREA